MDLRSEKSEVKNPHPVWNAVVKTIDYPFDKMADVLVALDADPSRITVSKIPLTLASIGIHQFHPIAGVTAFVLASIPDILDGKVARKSGKVTKEGAMIDSLTDKVVNAYMYLYVFSQMEWKNMPQDMALSLLMALNFSIDVVSQKMRGGLMEQFRTSVAVVLHPSTAISGKSAQEANMAGKVKAHLQCYGLVLALMKLDHSAANVSILALFATSILLAWKSIHDRKK